MFKQLVRILLIVFLSTRMTETGVPTENRNCRSSEQVCIKPGVGESCCPQKQCGEMQCPPKDKPEEYLCCEGRKCCAPTPCGSGFCPGIEDQDGIKWKCCGDKCCSTLPNAPAVVMMGKKKQEAAHSHSTEFPNEWESLGSVLEDVEADDLYDDEDMERQEGESTLAPAGKVTTAAGGNATKEDSSPKSSSSHFILIWLTFTLAGIIFK